MPKRPLHHFVVPSPAMQGRIKGEAGRDADPPPFTGEGDHEVVEGAQDPNRMAGRIQACNTL